LFGPNFGLVAWGGGSTVVAVGRRRGDRSRWADWGPVLRVRVWSSVFGGVKD